MTAPRVTERDVAPHDPAAEAAVLGACMNHPDVAADLLVAAPPEAFWCPSHTTLAGIIGDLLRRGLPPEPAVVATELPADSSLSPADLTRMVIDSPSDGGARHCAEVVMGYHHRRLALQAATELRDAGERDRVEQVLPGVLTRLGEMQKTAPGQATRRHLKPGDVFVLDSPTDLAPVWGSGDDVLWAAGEPLLVVGPTGVGKTTLAMQLVAARLGIVGDVLGLPVAASERPLLYLAMDRPNQIRRAMARLFSEEHRDVLRERLIVWEGPLPADLGKAPTLLAQMADDAGAGTVLVDSIKDAAVKLTDDEVGGNVNRAMQHLVAGGVEAIGLHHQRKGQAGVRPRTLEDVYGSTWLTAGAGSVILLWGNAGDPVVELVHLKQPAGEVGPLKIEHDHLTGQTIVSRGQVDPVAVLRNSRNGATAMDLARIMFECDKPSDNQRKKAQRSLDRLVKDNLAHRREPTIGGEGGSAPARYYLAERQLKVVSNEPA